MIQNRHGWQAIINLPMIIIGLMVVMNLLIPNLSFSQKVRFELFTTNDGLAGNNTSTVVQDEQGLLWFVNDGKIHRYDGRNFLIYPHPAEMKDDQAPFLGLAICEDSLLFLWSEKYLYLLNPKTGGWQKINVMGNRAQIENFQFYPRMGQEQILLIMGMRDLNEMNIIRLRNNQMEAVPLPEHIHTLKGNTYWCDIDASGHIYLAYMDTLYHMDPAGKEISATPLNSICTGCYNLYFRFGPDGTLVLLANWNFYMLDRINNRFIPHPANRFLKSGQTHLHRFILEDDGSIWGCGMDRNLVYYDATDDTLFNFHDELLALLPNQNDFKGLYRDRTGMIWIESRMGLLKVRPMIFHFETYFTGLNPSDAYFSFRGLTEDMQGMIYAVYYDGIVKFDPARKQPARFFTKDNIINYFDLFTDEGLIWLNAGQYLDPGSSIVKEIPSPFHLNPLLDNGFFARDKNRTLWWASHYSVYRLKSSGTGFQWVLEMELPEKSINRTDALHAGMHSGKLWISFKGKLLQYDPVTREQAWFSPADWGQPVSRIMAIEEDRAGKLWLATDAGLIHFDPAYGTAIRFSVNEGLVNNFVCGMLTEGDTCLWLSTNHGLSRFHIPSATFINFFKDDGLTNNEFNRKSYYKARNGRMYFGGIQGLNSFFPDEVERAYNERNLGARLVLSALEYTDERSDTVIRESHFGNKPEVHLHYYDWSYTFEFALTDYGSPEEILYSYKMEGYKDSWSTPSKFNFAKFNSLPPGNYIFRVKARDSRGGWHPSELAVKVFIHGPWWANWWAYSIYGLLLLSLAFLLRRYELNRQRLKHHLELEKLEKSKLQELDGFKSRLYTNLTHEFRTPLTVILGISDRIKDPSARLIEKNGRILLRLINQLLDLSKMENNSFKLNLIHSDIVYYLRYLTESFQTYANSKNLSLRFVTTLESLEMDYDPEQINHLFVNLVSNAIKFTPSGGDVVVRVFQQKDKFGIEVEDNGIGIAEKDLPHIFDRFYQADSPVTGPIGGTGIGLAYVQELVKLMGGEISVKSIPGKGTAFLVSQPIRNEAPLHEKPFQEEKILPFIPGIASASPAVELESEPAAVYNMPQLLIIEDNPDLVTYLRSILQHRFKIDIAYNGKIGIEKALETIPDIIVSDVMMPEKDGLAVCDTLKSDERTSHVPIILLTAKAGTEARINGLRRGADVYLTKPFEREELLAQMEMLMERQKRMADWFARTFRGDSIVAPPETADKESLLVENAFIQKVRNIIEVNYEDENFSLPLLCLKVGMSRSQLFRKMTALIDTSPSDYLRSFRLAKAKQLLETSDLTVSEVTYKVGYKDVAHFSKSFQEEYGFPPSATRK